MGRPRKIKPTQFEVPGNALDIFGDLTATEQSQFISELFQALVVMKQQNDLKALQNVVESWWNSLLLRRRQGSNSHVLEVALD